MSEIQPSNDLSRELLGIMGDSQAEMLKVLEAQRVSPEAKQEINLIMLQMGTKVLATVLKTVQQYQ